MRISDWSSDVCSSDLLQLFEEAIGEGPKEILLKYISYLFEHRDLEKEFVDPAYSTEEKVEIAQELRQKTVSAGLSDHRREQFLGILDPLIQRLAQGDQRRSNRTQAGQIGRASCRATVGQYV